jgi:hypothetical protein
MAVMMPRETWTDDRLDDLSRKVDAGFARLDSEVRDLRSEMNMRFDSMQRAHYAGVIAIVAALIATRIF